MRQDWLKTQIPSQYGPPAAFCWNNCFWLTKITPAPTAPTKSKIPKIVAMILPLFLFGGEEPAIIGGISMGSDTWAVVPVSCGTASTVGMSVISGNVGGVESWV